MLGGVLELELEEIGEVTRGDREFEWLAPAAFEVSLAAKKDAVDPDPEDEPDDPVEDDDDLDDDDLDDDDEDDIDDDDDLIDLDDEWDGKDEDEDKHDSPRKFFD